MRHRANTGATEVDVLPYHSLGEGKADFIGSTIGKLALPSGRNDEARLKVQALESEGRKDTVSG
jgi:hypothetical protein